MKVWSIQTLLVWERLQNTGYLRCADASLIEPPYLLAAYQWMVEQMRQRIGPPPLGVEYPVWAWVQYDGVDKARPDLRRAAHLPPGEPGVLLEYECSTQEVLCSDFDAWYFVLNNWYLPGDEAEELAFVRRWGRLGTDKLDAAAEKSASWQRIFDLDWCDAQHEYALPREAKRIQGTLWELHLDRIKSVRPIVARGRARH